MDIFNREIKITGRVVRIAHLDADTDFFLEDPEQILDRLRNFGTRVDIFTFMQRVPETKPKWSYPMEWHNLAVLPVSTFDRWWTQQIQHTAKVATRKAEKKGVTARVLPFDGALVRGIWEVYNECPVRRGKPFSHYGESVEEVYREEATYLDSSIFIGAFLEEKMIGFAKLVVDETLTQASFVNIISMVRHSEKDPTNTLVAKAVQTCADRKIPYLVYGNFVYGRKKPDGLTAFKRHNGFERMDLPRYYVPLTRVGRAALQLGLHHRLAERIPEALSARFRVLRSRWYNWRLKA
jgi:hypothetical protein